MNLVLALPTGMNAQQPLCVGECASVGEGFEWDQDDGHVCGNDPDAAKPPCLPLVCGKTDVNR